MQTSCFEAANQFAKIEGIIRAPETSHAIRAALDEALLCKGEGKEKTILFCLSGHGLLDMQVYSAFTEGKLVDYDYPEDKINQNLANLPTIQ